MKTIQILILSASFFAVSCEKNQTAANSFNLSKSEVLDSESKKRGEVFFVEGAPGPYKFGSTAYGSAGSETSHQTFNEGGASFVFPKDARFTYEASSYINKDGYALIVARRVPVPTDSKDAEQPGAGQPATQPADNAPAKDQPSTPTPKDAPR